MTPTLLALSRAYLALPGAPVRDMIADELVNRTPDGHPRYRDRAGLLWCPDTEADRPAPWVLDFRDAATGGVMLERLGPVMEPIVSYSADGGYCIRRMWKEFGPGCPALAEAVARAAVALGRAG